MATSQVLTQGIPLVTTVTDRRVLRPDELFHIIGGPDNAPYYLLYSMLGFEPCQDEKVQWYMDEDVASVITITAASSNSDTSIDVSDKTTLVKGQLLYCPRTGESLLVGATPSTNEVTVVRGVGDTAAAALVVGDQLFVGPSVAHETDGPVDTYSVEPWLEYNYIARYQHGWKVSKRSNAIELWGQAKLQYEEEKHSRKLMREIEVAFLYGPRDKITSNTSEVRTFSGGVKTLGTQSGSRAMVRSFDGVALTIGSFNNMLKDYFSQSSPGGNKVCLCGFNLVTIINNWAMSKLVINDRASDAFGVKVFRYDSPFGSISLLPHKLWNTLPPMGFGVQDEAWVIDLDCLKRTGLPGRPTEVTMTVATNGGSDLQSNGYDYIHRQLEVENGLKLKGSENFLFMSGING
jgi:hypothetical protein